MSEPVRPIVNQLNAPFWAAAEAERLVLPWCVATRRFFWPPSPFSPFATGGAVDWREAAAGGALTAVAIYRRVFQKAFEAATPYGVAQVALDAGPRLLAHLADPGLARAGDRVEIAFAAVVPGGPKVPCVRVPRISS